MPSPVNKTMRQGQQHRRGGGRGPKPQNALSRYYESNGPDVKLRGTAAQIAEKYMSLARDALVSGDMVAAESYFQHAEHYNRIIMATRIQSGGDGGDIRDRRDGGRNMPGLASEHGRPEGGNGTEANYDANGSDQADPQKSDKDGADPVSECHSWIYALPIPLWNAAEHAGETGQLFHEARRYGRDGGVA